MAKILIVLLAYLLIYEADYFNAEYYYFVCSAIYALIAIICCILPSSKLLLLYATANLLTSIAYLMLNFGLFAVFEYVIWNAPLNLSLISEVIECMLILNGASSVFVFITDNLQPNTSKRALCGNSMAKVK